MDRQVVEIFTKVLRSNKLQHFLEMLGLQHLDVTHLKGRTSTGEDTGEAVRDEEKIETRGDKDENQLESTKDVSTSDKVGMSGYGSRVTKDRAA